MNESLLALLLDHLSEAVVLAHATGLIFHWNLASQRLFGYSKEEAAGFNLVELVTDDQKADLNLQLQRSSQDSPCEEIEVVARTKDNLRIPILLSLVPVKDDHGNTVCIAALAHQRPAHEELALAFAHDLRNPLATLQNLAHLLEHRMDMRDIERMKKQLMLCESILYNFLEYSRTRMPQREPVMAASLIEATIGLLDFPANVELLVGPLAPARVFVDPVQIRQVLLNLLQNSLEAFERRPGKVEIAATEEEGFVRIDVKDNGPGISEFVLGKMFQTRVSTKEKGLGLGLAASKKLVEINGGILRLEGSSDSGSLLYVYLPLFASESSL